MGRKATTLDAQIELLKNRGMIISNVEKAKKVLYDVGYYRLGYYWFPFEKSYPNKDNRTHEFVAGTRFESAVKLYYFDFYLRSILLRALSRIEISFRTKVIYSVSNEYVKIPSWFADNDVVTNKQVKYYQEGAVRVILYMLKKISEKRYLELKKEIDDLICKYGSTDDIRNVLLNISGFKDLNRY